MADYPPYDLPPFDPSSPPPLVPPAVPPPIPTQAACMPSGISGNPLRQIARYQRAICLCVLTGMLVFMAFHALIQLRLYQPASRGQMPDLFGMLVVLVLIGTNLIATVSTFSLAIRLHGAGIGVLMGLLTLIPLVGLVVLLVVFRQATCVLKRHGIRVGLLGANPNTIC